MNKTLRLHHFRHYLIPNLWKIFHSFLTGNHGFRLGGADSHPCCFTLSCEPLGAEGFLLTTPAGPHHLLAYHPSPRVTWCPCLHVSCPSKPPGRLHHSGKDLEMLGDLQVFSTSMFSCCNLLWFIYLIYFLKYHLYSPLLCVAFLFSTCRIPNNVNFSQLLEVTQDALCPLWHELAGIDWSVVLLCIKIDLGLLPCFSPPGKLFLFWFMSVRVCARVLQGNQQWHKPAVKYGSTPQEV